MEQHASRMMSVGSEEAHYMPETLETLVRDLVVATRGRHYVTVTQNTHLYGKMFQEDQRVCASSS